MSDQNPRSALGARQRKPPHDWIAQRDARPNGDAVGTVGPRRHFLGLGELGTPWPGWAATGRPVRPVFSFLLDTFRVILYTPGSISPVSVWLFSSSPLSTRGRYTQFAGRRLSVFQLLYLHSANSAERFNRPLSSAQVSPPVVAPYVSSSIKPTRPLILSSHYHRLDTPRLINKRPPIPSSNVQIFPRDSCVLLRLAFLAKP